MHWNEHKTFKQTIMNFLPDIDNPCLDVLFLFALYFIAGAGKEYLKTSEYQDEMARRKVNFPDLPTMLLISLQVVSQLAKEKSR